MPVNQGGRANTSPGKCRHRIAHVVFQPTIEGGKILANVKDFQISGRMRTKRNFNTRFEVSSSGNSCGAQKSRACARLFNQQLLIWVTGAKDNITAVFSRYGQRHATGLFSDQHAPYEVIIDALQGSVPVVHSSDMIDA